MTSLENSDDSYTRALQTLINENAEDLYQSLQNHDPQRTGLVPAAVLGQVISAHLGLTGEDIGLLLSRGPSSSFQVAPTKSSNGAPSIKVRYTDILEAKPTPRKQEVREKAETTPYLLQQQPPPPPSPTWSNVQGFAVGTQQNSPVRPSAKALQLAAVPKSHFGTKSALPDGGAASRHLLPESNAAHSNTPFQTAAITLPRSSNDNLSSTSTSNSRARSTASSAHPPSIHTLTHELNAAQVNAHALRVQLSKTQAREQSAVQETEELYNRLRASVVRDTEHKEEKRQINLRMANLTKTLTTSVLPLVATQNETLQQLSSHFDSSVLVQQRDLLSSTLEKNAGEIQELTARLEKLGTQVVAREEMSRETESKAGALLLYKWSFHRDHCNVNAAFSKWNQYRQRVQVHMQDTLTKEMKSNLEDCMSKLSVSISNTDVASARASQLSLELDTLQQHWTQATEQIKVLEPENQRLQQELAVESHKRRGLEAEILISMEREHSVSEELKETKLRVGEATANVLLLEDELSSSKMSVSVLDVGQQEQEQQQQQQEQQQEHNNTIVNAAVENEMLQIKQEWEEHITRLQIEVEALTADRNSHMVVHNQTRRQLAEALGQIEEQKELNSGVQMQQGQQERARIGELELHNSQIEEKHMKMQHRNAMRTMKGVVRKMQHQMLWHGLSRWCTIVKQEKVAKQHQQQERQERQERDEREERQGLGSKLTARIGELELHNSQIKEKHLQMQHRNAMRTMKGVVRKMQHQILWHGLSRWCAIIKQEKEAENLALFTATRDSVGADDLRHQENKKMTAKKHAREMKLLRESMADTQESGVRRSKHLVAVVLVQWWHSKIEKLKNNKIEKSWRKWREYHNESYRVELLQIKAVNAMIQSYAARKYQKIKQAHIPMLRWKIHTIDAAKNAARQQMVQSMVGQSLLRKMSSLTQRIFRKWWRYVQLEKRHESKRATTAMEEQMKALELERHESKQATTGHLFSINAMEEQMKALELAQAKNKEKQLICKLNRILSTRLRRLFMYWKTYSLESKLDTKMKKHREFKANMQFAKLMSNKLQSTVVRWREYVFEMRFVRLKETNDENRVVHLLKHLLKSKLQKIVARWHQCALHTKHTKALVVEQELHDNLIQEKRELQIKHTMKKIFQNSIRSALSRWHKYMHHIKFERQLNSHKSTRVESMFLARLSNMTRSCWIRWREYVHENKMETLRNETNESKVIQMVRNRMEKLLATARRIITRWHKYALERRMERQTLKHQETYVATKLASIMMSSSRYYLSRWQKYAHHVKLETMHRVAQEQKATAIIHRILRSTLRNCMKAWHRYCFNAHLERKEIAGREARVLDMFTKLITNGQRRIVVSWHKFALRQKYERSQKRHNDSRLEHGFRVVNTTLRRFNRKSIGVGWKTWLGVVDILRKREDHQDAILQKVAATIRRIAYRGIAIAFHRLTRHAHHMQNHVQRVRTDQKRIVRELIANLNRRMLYALTTWKKAIHLRTMEDIERRHVLERETMGNEIKKSRRESIVMVQQVRDEQVEATKRMKMIAAIKRLYNKGLEKMAKGLRKWKAVHELSGHTANGAMQSLSRKQEMQLSGLSMLSLWAKGQLFSIKMRRFNKWRQFSHQWSHHNQKQQHQKASLDLQTSQQNSLRQNGIARMMQRSLMGDRALLKTILQQWHVLAIHLAPLQRTHRRQSIVHGGATADNLLDKWSYKGIQRSFKIWSTAVVKYQAREQKKIRARTVTSRVLRRMANKEMAASFHKWRRIRYQEMLHEQKSYSENQVKQRVANTMSMVVNRMYKLKLWRAMNKWCTMVGIDRVHSTMLGRLVSKEQCLYVRSMLGPLIRWVQQSKMRAFASWSFHAHVGSKLYRKFRKREGLLRAACVLHDARLPGARGAFLRRSWNTWQNLVLDYRQKKSAQQMSTRMLQRVVLSMQHRQLSKAWKVWAIATYSCKYKTEFRTVGTRTLAMQLGRVVKGFVHRNLSRAWRKWTTDTLRKDRKKLLTHSRLSIAVKVVNHWNHRKMSGAFHVWVSADRAVVVEESKKVEATHRGVARKKEHARQQEEQKTRTLSEIVHRKKMYQKTRLAVACWRWSTNAASTQHDKLSASLIRNKMQVTRMESKCTVYRNQQIRDAAISASFEKELIKLRQRVKGLKESQKEGKRIERDRNRRGAVLRLVSIKTAQERQHMRTGLTAAWLRWRERVGHYKQVDLANQLSETKIQSRLAAGRISNLVERAQAERAQTVKLLLTMKQRTTAMEDQVVGHVVGSPVLERSVPTPLVTPAAPFSLSASRKKKKKSSSGSVKKRNRKFSSPSPVSQDPYHLIVDQMLRVVSSKKRTLYSHSITDLLTLFQAIDLNCDGNISDAEFGDAMKRLDINISTNQLQYLLAEMRREDGRISYRGFINSMKYHHDALKGLEDHAETKDSSIRRGSYWGTYKT